MNIIIHYIMNDEQLYNINKLSVIYIYINNKIFSYHELKTTKLQNEARFNYIIDFDKILLEYKTSIVKKIKYKARTKDFYDYYLPKEHWNIVLQNISDKVFNSLYFTDKEKDDIEIFLKRFQI